MAGTIAADTLTHSTAGSLTTDYVVNGSAKAWVHYNQDTDTANTSFNVSTVTDNTTGDNQCNYVSSFDAANYCLQVSGKTDDDNANTPGNRLIVLPYESTASNGSAICIDSGGTTRDPKIMCYTTFGDLA